MFLQALHLKKGMSGTESLSEKIPGCLCLFQKEFRDQLKWFEEELSSVSQLVVESLLKVHEQKLSSSAGHIQHLFNRQLKEWEDVKVCVQTSWNAFCLTNIKCSTLITFNFPHSHCLLHHSLLCWAQMMFLCLQLVLLEVCILWNSVSSLPASSTGLPLSNLLSSF